MTNNQETNFFFYINAAIQLAAILIFQYTGVEWLLYITMFLLALLILIQTLSSAFLFSNGETTIRESLMNNKYGIGMLTSLLYLVSCYHIYMIGFVGFAWVAFAHVIIQFLANFFGALK